MVHARNSFIMLFLMTGFSPLNTLNKELYIIDEKVVEKKAQAIQRTLVFHTRVEKMLQCTSTLAVVYYLYQMVLSGSGKCSDQNAYQSIEKIDSSSPEKSISLYQQVVAFPIKIIDTVKTIPYDFFAVVKSGELLQSLGSMIGNYVLISIINFAIESSLNKVSHRHTIDWYVQTHAPYQHTLSLCIKQIENYENQQIDVLKNNYTMCVEYDILIGMSNLLLQDLENIAAYMACRIPVIKKQYQQDAVTIQKIFLNYILDWRSQIHNVVFVEKDVSKLKLLLNQSYNEVDRMYKMFALYEKHVNHYSIIKKLFC